MSFNADAQKYYGDQIKDSKNHVVPNSFKYISYPHIIITPCINSTPKTKDNLFNDKIIAEDKITYGTTSFILPLTMAVQSGNTFTWSEQTAGESLSDFPRIAGNEIMKSLGSFIKSLVDAGDKETVEGRVMEVAGNTLMYKTRLMADDFLKQLYSGHDFRKFSFNFTFVAGNKEDLLSIVAFIILMQKITLPSKGGSMKALGAVTNMVTGVFNKIFGGDVEQAVAKLYDGLPTPFKKAASNASDAIDGLTSWIGYPAWFDIKFAVPVFSEIAGKTEATNVRELFKTTVMACESFMVQYGSDENGIRVTKDGIPIEYKITMSFVEVYRKFRGAVDGTGGSAFS